MPIVDSSGHVFEVGRFEIPVRHFNKHPVGRQLFYNLDQSSPEH